jgi:hypothetical protein
MSHSPLPQPGQTVRRRGLPLIVVVGALVTLGGVLALIVCALGYRAGAWTLHAASLMAGIAAWIALAGSAISVLAAALTRPGAERRGFAMSVVAAVVGAVVFGAVAWWHLCASRAPCAG